MDHKSAMPVMRRAGSVFLDALIGVMLLGGAMLAFAEHQHAAMGLSHRARAELAAARVARSEFAWIAASNLAAGERHKRVTLLADQDGQMLTRITPRALAGLRAVTIEISWQGPRGRHVSRFESAFIDGALSGGAP
ncbi:MAG: hypothetical protein MRY63_08465 [Neomegalonema sp.]|nr:hypothetical protein [Neomegalonema sp.]